MYICKVDYIFKKKGGAGAQPVVYIWNNSTAAEKKWHAVSNPIAHHIAAAANMHISILCNIASLIKLTAPHIQLAHIYSWKHKFFANKNILYTHFSVVTIFTSPFFFFFLQRNVTPKMLPIFCREYTRINGFQNENIAHDQWIFSFFARNAHIAYRKTRC